VQVLGCVCDSPLALESSAVGLGWARPLVLVRERGSAQVLVRERGWALALVRGLGWALVLVRGWGLAQAAAVERVRGLARVLVRG
jgi:hypothetical protein